MDSLFIAINVVFPLLFWMVAGWLSHKSHLVKQTWIAPSNSVICNVFLPFMLFLSVYESDLFQLQNREWLYAIFICIGVVLTFFILFAVVPRCVADNPTRGSFVLGTFRSNTALYALPIARVLYSGMDIGFIALVVAILVPLYNLLSIITIEYFKVDKINVGRLIRSVVINPMNIAVLVAIVCVLFDISLNESLLASVQGLSNVTAPLSFFVLGASFKFKTENKPYMIIAGVMLKTVIIAFVWVMIAILLGYRGQSLFSVLIVFAAPSAVSSYSMAHEGQLNYKLSGELLVYSSCISIATIFLWILSLSYFKML